MCAFSLVTSISAVISAVTDGGSRCAVGVLTLEGTSSAVTYWTCLWLIRSIHTILLTITLPEPWYTFLIATITSVLSICTVSDASLHVSSQVELVGASAPGRGCSFFSITLDVQVTGFVRRRNQAEMRASTVVISTRIRISQLS